MLATTIGENVTFKIEVEEKPLSILLVFDKKCDAAIISWEDANALAEVMNKVIADVEMDFQRVTDRVLVLSEQAQIKLNHHKGLVALVVNWTDRVRFTTIESFFMVMMALRKTAQDAYLEMRKGILFRYDREGMIAKIHNLRTGVTQHVR